MMKKIITFLSYYFMLLFFQQCQTILIDINYIILFVNNYHHIIDSIHCMLPVLIDAVLACFIAISENNTVKFIFFVVMGIIIHLQTVFSAIFLYTSQGITSNLFTFQTCIETGFYFFKEVLLT